jgi:hypothetical protein
MSWWHCSCCFKGRSRGTSNVWGERRGARHCDPTHTTQHTRPNTHDPTHIYTHARARHAATDRHRIQTPAGSRARRSRLCREHRGEHQNTPWSLAARPWPRTTLRVSRAGLLLAPNDPHRSGTVCSSHPARPPHVVHPAQDGSAPTRRSLISKHLFHRLYNSNSIASETHEHKSVSVDLQSHRRTM